MSDHPIIALVCSAGGLEAVTAVLTPLPAGLPATVVVLQHSTPDAPAMLAPILSRRTALPVTTVATTVQIQPLALARCAASIRFRVPVLPIAADR